MNSTKTFAFFLIAIGISFSTVAQKKLKRPGTAIGLANVDSLVIKSFDMYDDVYGYQELIESGKGLKDEDYDVLEHIVEESAVLSEYAIDAASDLDGVSVFKQGKAALQLNRARKALSYCLSTGKELLVAEVAGTPHKEPETETPLTETGQ